MMIVLDVLFFGVLLEIAYVDYKTRYIYDLHLIAALLVAVVRLFFADGDWIDALGGAAMGFALGYLMYKLAYLYYKEEAFGFGDVLLLGVLGFYYGLLGFLSCFCITYLILGVLIILPVVFEARRQQRGEALGRRVVGGADDRRLDGEQIALGRHRVRPARRQRHALVERLPRYHEGKVMSLNTVKYKGELLAEDERISTDTPGVLGEYKELRADALEADRCHRGAAGRSAARPRKAQRACRALDPRA